MPWKKSEPMDQRLEFCWKAVRGGNFRALCREYGISAKTGYKWQERFLREGANGMVEESRRPRSHPESLREEELCRIVALKLAHPHWGPRKIRELYLRQQGKAASESSFKRVLERSGLTQKRRVRPASQSGRLCSGRTAQEPNQVWTVDFKGWWYSGLGRCEPLTVRDEHSRYLLELRALENARSATVQQHFERLFERYGLPESIRSDNGSPFASRCAVHGLSRLSAWWVALGIDLERGRPGHPQDNGAHERLHRDISLELQCLGHIDQQSLELWRQEFNDQRPHQALGMRCPSELYRHSTRPYRGGVQQLNYPRMITRRVNKNGRIYWAKHYLFVSSSLAGWSVGLQPTDQDQFEVWFARLLLGWLDPKTASFRRADLPATTAQSDLKSPRGH
jgi:Transposase and inactivated derivatives